MNKRTLAGAVAAIALHGCTTDNKNSALPVTAIVLGVVTPVTDPVTNVVTAGCVFSASTLETAFPVFAANGTNNKGSVGVVVKNQISVPTTVNAVFTTDTTTFSPHQAVVDYEIIGGTQTIAQQIVPVSGGSFASGISQTVVVPLFLPTAASTVLKTLASGSVVRVTVRIEGKLDDGSTVSTSEHEIVVSTTTAGAGTNSPCF